MSKAKGPFDSAIGVLKREVQYWRDWAERFDSCQSAISVLEAAGKVDKVSELATLAVIRTELNLRPHVHRKIDESVRRVRALLESLPDKEEK